MVHVLRVKNVGHSMNLSAIWEMLHELCVRNCMTQGLSFKQAIVASYSSDHALLS